LQGEPHAVFAQAAALRALQLDVPYPTHLAQAIAERVPGFPSDTLTVTELVSAIVAHSSLRGPSPSRGAVPYAAEP
jgi:hypothetical protein